MGFDEGLAERIRMLLAGQVGVREVRMFGALCFLADGNMACGIVGAELMVRVGADAWPDALSQPHAREMDFTRPPMKGMVYVSADGFAEDADLARWIGRGMTYARSLPPK
jgi:TfoX/Sxy family transcriptional regulator of competence genes